MKKWLAVMLALALGSNSWGAHKISGDSTPADISRMALGTRQLAMGRTSIAAADDAGGFMLNPAGLAGIRSREVNTMMTKLVGEFNYYSLSYVHPTRSDTFGVNVLYNDPGSIPRVNELDENGYPKDSGETIPAGTTLMTVGYGRKWSPTLYLGALVKHYNQYLDDAHGTSLGLDVGMIYTLPVKDLYLGVVAVNAVQQGLRWDTADKTETNFPAYLKVGVAWEVLNKNLTLAIDDDIGRFNKIHLGAEYWLNKNFAFRLGTYDEVLTMGLGLRYGFLQIDYAYSQDPAPVEHTAYVSLTFGDARESELDQPEIYILEE